jgi:ABC-type antimicrobial peptide transport system permease subunit
MPVRLTAIIFTAPPARGITGDDNSIVFDDIAVSAAGGNKTIIEDFESATPTWETIVSSSVTPDSFEVTTDQKQSGARGGKVSLAQGTSTARRGIFPISDRVPLPIAASEQLLGELGLSQGGQTVLLVGNVPVPVVVRSTYELFPTLFSEDGASALVNRDDLNAWLRTWATAERVEMNEAWFTLDPGVTPQQREEFAASLQRAPFRLDEETVDRAALFAEIDQDPLLAAGGTGILAIGFVATLVLLAAAAVVVLFTDAERRRPELAVMRALGFSRGQTARMLILEYGLLIVFGLGLGAFLGRQLGDRMLSFLNVTEDGEQVEPEFILQTDWALLGLSALVIIASFGITLALVLAIARRISAGQVLRTD